jgi:hypothetical protein
LWLEKINQNLKIKRDFYSWRSLRVCELLRSWVACFPSIVCTSKAKGWWKVETWDWSHQAPRDTQTHSPFLLKILHSHFDVKSVLNENLGGILGDTQCENLAA